MLSLQGEMVALLTDLCFYYTPRKLCSGYTVFTSVCASVCASVFTNDHLCG